MSLAFLYGTTGMIIFVLGFRGLIVYAHFIRKVMAINVMGSGIFMFLIAMAHRTPTDAPDPVPHAMVLTGIVVSVSATAFILALIVRLYNVTGHTSFEEIAAQTKEAPDV